MYYPFYMALYELGKSDDFEIEFDNSAKNDREVIDKLKV